MAEVEKRWNRWRKERTEMKEKWKRDRGEEKYRWRRGGIEMEVSTNRWSGGTDGGKVEQRRAGT